MLKKVRVADIAEELKEFREARTLTQDDLARMMGVAQSTIQNWENGRTSPRPKMALRIRALAGGPETTEKKKARRYNEERIVQAHTALDLILDRARSDVVEKVMADLAKFAGRFGEEKS